MDQTVEGKVYINGTFQKCCIGISNGKISTIKRILKADEHFDFGNKLVLPAGIDIHVHFRDPGYPKKEDFSSGTMAAAFGGVSCVFDMPNTNPQTTSIQTLTDKISSANKKSFVDFGVYAGLTDNNIKNLVDLSKKCNGFKIFLGSSTNSLNFSLVNLKKALKLIEESHKPVLFHAEDEKCLSKHVGLEKDIESHLKHRPFICEEKAIRNILNYSKDSNCKIHICHLSSCEGLELLRGRNSNISCGVTPHHIFFDVNKTLSSTFLKVNPPIRSNFDKEMLFNGLKNGIVDILESDHAPHTFEEKEVDFNIAPSGVPGVETLYPLFLYLAKKDQIPFQRLISAFCEKPAHLLGISKGYIQVGCDADFAIIDLKNESKINSDNLHSKCDWSPFEGYSAVFPSCVFVRGERLIEDNEIQVSQGFGRFVGV